MATKYLHKFPAAAALIAASPDRSLAQGIGSISGQLFANVAGVAVRLMDALSPSQQALTTLTGDGAISPSAGFARMTKGSAAAATLAAPTAAQEGMDLYIAAGSAFAHVVTATGLVDDGVTGGAKTTMTFAAFVGSAIHLKAMNLHWVVIAKNLVTIT
jgi:hypothetical protein